MPEWVMMGLLPASLDTEPPRLSQTMQLVSVGEEPTQDTPAPAFAEIVQLVRVGKELSEQ
jgi:hypothetical protein